MRSIVIALLLISCASTRATNENGFEIQLNESKPNSSAQANIEVRAIRSNGNPVEGVEVSLIDSKIDTKTDRLGIAKIHLNDALLKDRLKIKSALLSIDLRGFDRVLAIVID